MVGGCRLQSHSRTTGQHAAQQWRERNHEHEQEAKFTQHNLEFCGMGLLPIVLHTDADVAPAFCHKRGLFCDTIESG